MMIQREKQAWVVNDYRVKVKKCCASCLHKELDEDGNRFCMKMPQLKVHKRFVCPMWEMSVGLMYAGHRWGTVKKLTEIVIR